MEKTEEEVSRHKEVTSFLSSSSGKIFRRHIESEVDKWFNKMIDNEIDHPREFYAGGIRFGALLLASLEEPFAYSEFLEWKLKEAQKDRLVEKKSQHERLTRKLKDSRRSVINSP